MKIFSQTLYLVSPDTSITLSSSVHSFLTFNEISLKREHFPKASLLVFNDIVCDEHWPSSKTKWNVFCGNILQFIQLFREFLVYLDDNAFMSLLAVNFTKLLTKFDNSLKITSSFTSLDPSHVTRYVN